MSSAGGASRSRRPRAFLLTAVEQAAAEHYQRVISEKTRDALARLRDQGQRVSGRVPYGDGVAIDGKTLEPEAGEQATLGRIQELAPGRSLRGLAAPSPNRGSSLDAAGLLQLARSPGL